MIPSWPEKLFRKFNPDYHHRWTVYDDILRTYITKDSIWLDIGCGRNEHVARFGHRAQSALGIDRIDSHDRADAPFLLADLRHIPLPSGHASLVTLRLVVEHLESVPGDFAEIARLLMPGGHLIILTTNSISPVIFLPRLLPFSLKSWILQGIFGVQSREVFPTYHRFNSPRKMAKGLPGLTLARIRLLEGVPLEKGLLVLPFWLWYATVKHHPLRFLRSNIIAVFEKVAG